MVEQRPPKLKVKGSNPFSPVFIINKYKILRKGSLVRYGSLERRRVSLRDKTAVF